MSSMIYKNKKPLFLFLVPAFAFLIVFLYYPFIQNIINSFSSISGLGTPATGLNAPWYQNYVTMWEDPNMRQAVINTLILTISTVVIQVGIALVLALLVDRIHRGAQFFRTVYFFPIVISATALGLLFNLIFLYNGGMANQLLQLFVDIENIDWKSESNHLYMFTMLVPIMWQYVGFYFVILVTGLNNISPDVYEAAELDGATGLRRVRYITLPLLRNVICTCMVLAVTGSLKVFDLPWVMFPSGMPLDNSWLTGTYMYYQTFIVKDVDYGSAISILIVVLGIVMARVANTVFKEKEY